MYKVEGFPDNICNLDILDYVQGYPQMNMKTALLFLLTGILDPTLANKQGSSVASEFSPFYYFDIQLAKELSDEENKNWVISPSSIKAMLGLLLEGSSGNSAAEISKILRISPNITEARDILWQTYQRLQDSNQKVVLKALSRILVRRELGLSSIYSKRCRDLYAAPATEVDFSSPSNLAKEVNAWINEATQGFIPQLVNEGTFSSNSFAVLLNAIYFKGDWLKEFDPKSTRPACFYNPGCKMVQMMSTVGSFKYGIIQNLKAKMIELPYSNRRFSLVILVPLQEEGLKSMMWDLPFISSSLLQILDNQPPSEIVLNLPKFTIEYNTDLIPILSKMGLKELFTDAANLTDLFGSRKTAKVNGLIHKGRIDVNEKGTIAAASTVAQVELLMLSKSKPKVVIDHPFFFFIRDRLGGFLFIGQLTDAENAQRSDQADHGWTKQKQRRRRH